MLALVCASALVHAFAYVFEWTLDVLICCICLCGVCFVAVALVGAVLQPCVLQHVVAVGTVARIRYVAYTLRSPSAVDCSIQQLHCIQC